MTDKSIYVSATINYANVNAHDQDNVNVVSLTLFLTTLETVENSSSKRSSTLTLSKSLTTQEAE
jgi:hypothetical protein